QLLNPRGNAALLGEWREGGMNIRQLPHAQRTGAGRAAPRGPQKTRPPPSFRGTKNEGMWVGPFTCRHAGRKTVRANHSPLRLGRNCGCAFPSENDVEQQVAGFDCENTLAPDLQAGRGRFMEDALTEGAYPYLAVELVSLCLNRTAYQGRDLAHWS